MKSLTLWFALWLAVAPAWAERWPASPDVLPTTDGAIYLHNLDQRISVLEAMHVRRPGAPGAASLAGALYHRYRIRGSLADAERAFVLVDEALGASDPDPEHFMLRATLRSGFHQFDQAESDLDAAHAHGMPATALASTRRDLALARGDYPSLRDALAAAAPGPDAGFDGLAFHAHLRHLQGDLAGASRLYAKAQDAYVDSSPVPLAWLYVQYGAALLDAGDARAARPFFAAAHERLPGYTLATEHLAETEALLGHRDRARHLYQAAIAASDDPAFIDALSQLERDAGNAGLAARLAEQARTGWDARIARHPAAFAGHAVEYFLDHGRSGRALELARQALRTRRDIDSLELLARAAAAVGDLRQACAARREIDATGLARPLSSPEPPCQ